jgi:hypothetical protein
MGWHPDIIWVQPFTVDKCRPKGAWSGIYLVDLAVNTRDPDMTKTFVEALPAPVMGIIDEHSHADWRQAYAYEHLSLQPMTRGVTPDIYSAGDVLMQCVHLDEIGVELCEAASFADRAMYRPKSIEYRANAVLKGDIRDDERRNALWRWHSGAPGHHDLAQIDRWAAEYELVAKRTRQLAAEARVYEQPPCVKLDVPANAQIDLTGLLMQLQQDHQSHIIVAAVDMPRAGRMSILCSGNNDILDAVRKVVPSASGTPRRVTIERQHESIALAALASLSSR